GGHEIVPAPWCVWGYLRCGLLVEVPLVGGEFHGGDAGDLEDGVLAEGVVEVRLAKEIHVAVFVDAKGGLGVEAEESLAGEDQVFLLLCGQAAGQLELGGNLALLGAVGGDDGDKGIEQGIVGGEADKDEDF